MPLGLVRSLDMFPSASGPLLSLRSRALFHFRAFQYVSMLCKPLRWCPIQLDSNAAQHVQCCKSMKKQICNRNLLEIMFSSV